MRTVSEEHDGLHEAIVAGLNASTVEECELALDRLQPFLADPDAPAYPEAWGASEQASMMLSALRVIETREPI